MPIPPRLSKQKFEARWPAVVVWVLAWYLLWYLDGVLNLGNLALLLVLASAVAGLWLSAALSVALSALSVLMFNWFFVEPRYTFSVNLQQDLLLLLTILSVSSVVSYLMVRLRMAAHLESQHAQASEQLRELGETLREITNVTAQGEFLIKYLQQTHDCKVAMLILEDDGDTHRVSGDPRGDTTQGLLACAQQCSALGPGTGRHEDQTTLFIPMRGRVKAIGAIALQSAAQHVSTHFKREFLQQVCDLFGLEVERAQTLHIAQEATNAAKNHALRNTLLTSVSHDYRTPLANLMGAASVIHDQTSKLSVEKIADLAQTVLDEAQHLNRMTTNTLHLARLDANPLHIKMDWESLHEILGSVLAKSRKRYPNRNFVVNVPNHLPLVRCEAILLVQLLDNLIDNAAQYSPESKPIEIAVGVSNDALVIRVMDEGLGIEDAWKHKVFQAFERVQMDHAQADASEKNQLRRGMGVGLAVCMAIAKVHNAKLWIEDRVPRGTAMCFSLPVTQQPDVKTEV